ncbi:hypothetical protein LCGC14_1172390 [marine sediment metagenome]|uniref:Uncharacterized protein n=1 Tax=marine sediment metagenome TaxID=412755 RepID=A0A0F9P7J0_9ZZZZ
MVKANLIAYSTTFRLRRAVRTAKSLEVTFPWVVAEKEAESLGLTVDEFLKIYELKSQWGDFPGVRYTFKPIDDGE